MADFKERLKDDIGRIFLKAREFTERHFVEGKEIDCILDTDIQTESKSAEDLGLAGADLSVNARIADLPERRAAGESLNVDGGEYIIVSWREDYGMAVVYLQKNQQG